MNLGGDLRYVTKEDTASFGGAAARKAAWDMQTGWIGKFVYNSFNITYIQNGHTLFSHADMSVDWAEKGSDQMNTLAHKALMDKKFKESIFTTYGNISRYSFLLLQWPCFTQELGMQGLTTF
jgi:hypothetical protein